MNNNWYVIQTKPMAEDRVCQQFSKALRPRSESIPRELLKTALNLFEPGLNLTTDVPFETFCPKIKCISGGKLSGAEGARHKPLFPSYVFLRCDLQDPAKHHMVKYTRGVNKVLGEKGRAVPISDEVVELIKSKANEGGIIEQKTFKVGDQIKVRRGHLRDLIGILERPVSDNGRVAVLLQLFNRQMRVHLECADIAKA